MTRIVLKNGEIIETNTNFFTICDYISSCEEFNEDSIWFKDTDDKQRIVDINDIKSIESI